MPILSEGGVCDLGTAILGQIALFKRRLQGAAPPHLALPYPFRAST